LGIEGSDEPIDLRLTSEMPFDEITERLNSVMPEGLYITRTAVPVRKATEIEKAQYEITSTAPVQLEEFFSQPQILIEKKTKKNTDIIDVKPLLQFTMQDSQCKIILPAGSVLNINPWNVLGVLEVENVRRVGILCGDGEVFV